MTVPTKGMYCGLWIGRMFVRLPIWIGCKCEIGWAGAMQNAG